MDKKKKDVADVGDLLREALTVVFWLWHGGKVGQSSLEAAERIAAHQGYHEAEVSCGGEADLHRHVKRCEKNPNHTQFIPVHDFKADHLPSDYRDNDLLEYIRFEADMTCRLSVRYTSENRPKFVPGSQPLSFYPFYLDRGGDWLRTGTGWVDIVDKYTEKDGRNCECRECSAPGTHTPKKVWGKAHIMTACHVVFDSDEARHATCEFFYDTSKTPISECPTLTGTKVEDSDIEEDWCHMICVSHDIDMIDMLYKMVCRRYQLLVKLYNKYLPKKNNNPSVPSSSCVKDPTPTATVIISHPHGCSKMITVGKLTNRETWTKTRRYKHEMGWEADQVATSYTYDTPTCRGSSGAPVMRLPVMGKWWVGADYHCHSEGGQGNVNKSVVLNEFVSPPITSLNI